MDIYRDVLDDTDHSFTILRRIVMSKDKIIKLMKSRGFTFVATNTIGSKVYLIFTTHHEITCNISCTVNLATTEFTFDYSSINSINRLVCGPCGSFENDKHFEKLREKFQRDAITLWMHNS